MTNEEAIVKNELAELLSEGEFLNIPKVGDLIKGRVLSTKGREVRIDVGGLTTGVVRGKELFTDSGTYTDLHIGQEVEATVIDVENENGEMELSFLYAGNKKSWQTLRDNLQINQTVDAKVLDANKGGLIVKVGHINGFLPVSQLAPENYPRVTGGDKQKILDKLNSFIGTTMHVKVLDLNEGEEKLIVSEKAVWEDEQHAVISQIKIGDLIEGEVTALADFGAFIKFFPQGGQATPLEGLVHISEIAWQRIDHPRDLLKIWQRAKAQIVGIEGSKIFLSMKKLVEDPWAGVEKRYKIGDVVEGKVLKYNPFGLFVELDRDIHGLAHVSELSNKPVADLATIAKIGETRQFKIVSIEPQEHRLGLSIKALEKPVVEEKPVTEEKPEEKKAEEPEIKTE
ncbi:MAG: S1 RNA-binding domain-containing protein [Patescibacteria group bacterium]|jgi:small subunit ribosomal protein S1